MRAGSGPSPYRAALACITLLAFCLHVWRLGSRDLWGDEVASLSLALEPIAEALRSLASFEPHPPLYVVALHFWTKLAGIDEFAVRYPSVVCAVLAVPLAAAIGTRLAGRFAGLAAAGALALSPLLHWYAQEARMYAPLILFGGWATYELIRALEREPQARPRYVAALLLAAYSHYYGLVLGLAHAATIVAWVSFRRFGRPSAESAADRSAQAAFWLPVAAGTVIGYAPWLLYASRIVADYQGVARGELDVVPVLRDIWLRLALGWSVEPPAAWWAAAPVLALALIGALAPIEQRTAGNRARAVLVLSVIGPVLLGAAVSLVRPMYAERYLVVGLVPFGVLIALGIHRCWSWRRPLGLLGLVVPAAFLGSLQNDALDPLYRKSEYQKLGSLERALKLPGERALLVGGSQYYLHRYYGEAAQDPVIAPELPPFDAAREGPRLERLLGDATGIWLYLYALADYDPSRRAERWADERYFRGDHFWAANGELVYYGTDQGGGSETRAAALASPEVGIQAIDVAPGPFASGAPVGVRVTYTTPPPLGTKIALRIVDATGMLWGHLDVSAHSADSGALRPGFVVRIAPGAPPGEYRLRAQLYGPGGPVVFRQDEHDVRDLDLGRLEVDRLSPVFAGALVPAFRGLTGDVAGGELLGVSGGEVGTAGERAFVYLAWRAGVAGGPGPARFELAGTDLAWPVRWTVSPASVAADDVVVVQQNLDLPASLKGGTYPLELVDEAGRRIGLGPLRVAGR